MSEYKGSRTTWRALDSRSARHLQASANTRGDGPRLFTRQLRYRLRHASNAGTAYPSVASEDSGTADECRATASHDSLLARSQQRSRATHKIKFRGGRAGREVTVGYQQDAPAG
jgi:hypothetical protein